MYPLRFLKAFSYIMYDIFAFAIGIPHIKIEID